MTSAVHWCLSPVFTVEYCQFRALEPRPNWEGLHNHNKNLYRSCSTFLHSFARRSYRWPNVKSIGIYLTESEKFQHSPVFVTGICNWYLRPVFVAIKVSSVIVIQIQFHQSSSVANASHKYRSQILATKTKYR